MGDGGWEMGVEMGDVSCGRRIGEDDSPSCLSDFSFFSLLSSHHHVSKIFQFPIVQVSISSHRN